MWRILGLVIFCGLLTPLDGSKPPGIRCSVSPAAFSQGVTDIMLKDNLLQNYLKIIKLPDVPIPGGLLGLVTSVIGLSIVDVQVTSIQMLPLPGIGAEQFLILKLKLSGLLLDNLSLLIEVSLDAKLHSKYKVLNFAVDNYQIDLLDCDLQVVALDINVLSGLLSLSAKSIIQDSLTTNLPPLVCSAVKTVIDLVKSKELSASVNVNIPLGTYGTVRFWLSDLPCITTGYYGIYFNTEIVTLAGEILSIPDDAISILDPPIDIFKISYGLHPDFLNIALTVLLQLQPLELLCTPDKFSGAVELQNAIKAQFAFQDCGAGPEPLSDLSVLYLKISIVEAPVCHFGSGNPSVRLSVQIKVFTKTVSGSACVVVVFKDTLVFDSIFSIIITKLKIVLDISSHELLLESGNSVLDLNLVSLIRSLLNEVWVPILNGRLSIGIPFPQLFGIPVTTIQVVPDCLKLCG